MRGRRPERRLVRLLRRFLGDDDNVLVSLVAVRWVGRIIVEVLFLVQRLVRDRSLEASKGDIENLPGERDIEKLPGELPVEAQQPTLLGRFVEEQRQERRETGRVRRAGSYHKHRGVWRLSDPSSSLAIYALPCVQF